MIYQNLIESLGRQLQQLTSARSTALRGYADAQQDSRRIGAVSHNETNARDRLRELDTQLAELADALGAVSRAALADRGAP